MGIGGRVFVIAGILAVCLGCYALEIPTGVKDLWPYPQLRSNKDRYSTTPIKYDAYGRLKAFSGKQKIACPAQTGRTAVLYIFGQSNSSNHGGQRYEAIDDRVISYYNGACYCASSPLLGAEGKLGESWTLLGNKLISDRKFDEVIIVPSRIGATWISEWASGR